MDAEHPYALDLLYLRNLSAQQIVQTSTEEMIRLRPESGTHAEQWQEQLTKIIPDVGLGDRLVGVFQPGKGVSFYAAEHHLGDIDSGSFAEAFAAIWLDEKTQSPSLRHALLGGNHDKKRADQA